MRRLILSSVMLLVASTASAQFETASSLYNECTSGEGYNRAYCYGYLNATVDSLKSTTESVGWTCSWPARLDTGQLYLMFVKYYRMYPEHGDKPVEFYLFKMFGCKQPEIQLEQGEPEDKKDKTLY